MIWGWQSFSVTSGSISRWPYRKYLDFFFSFSFCLREKEIQNHICIYIEENSTKHSLEERERGNKYGLPACIKPIDPFQQEIKRVMVKCPTIMEGLWMNWYRSKKLTYQHTQMQKDYLKTPLNRIMKSYILIKQMGHNLWHQITSWQKVTRISACLQG